MFDLDFLKTCTAGFGRMTDEAQDVLRQTVSLAQKPDGLFPDRSGHGDLYYTLFGLCLAYISGATVDRKACARTLEQSAPADLVHRAALAHSRNLLKLMALRRLGTLRGFCHVAATAAALCLHPDETTAAALAGLQNPDGTFPGGDLLSTAVSLYALHRTGHKANYDVRDFLSGCFRPTGLFAAVPADPFGDLEYTVYGLLALGATA